MSNLDNELRKMLGASGLYEDWGKSMIEAIEESASEPRAEARAVGPFRAPFGIQQADVEALRESVEPDERASRRGLAKLTEKGKGKSKCTTHDAVDSEMKTESAMEIIRQRMGIYEARYCGCGCGGEGHCAAMKAYMEHTSAANQKAARSAHFQKLVNESYSDEMRELRRAAGIVSEHVDQLPPSPGKYAVRTRPVKNPLW